MKKGWMEDKEEGRKPMKMNKYMKEERREGRKTKREGARQYKRNKYIKKEATNARHERRRKGNKTTWMKKVTETK